MKHLKITAKHFYRVQKILNLGDQLLKKSNLARHIHQHNKTETDFPERKEEHKKIIIKFMKENGVIFSSKLNSNPDGECFVYFIQQDGGEGSVKIGRSNNVGRRLKNLQTGPPYRLSVIAKIPTKDKCSALCLEKSFHEKLAKYKLNGEWFSKSVLAALKEIAL